MTFGTNHQGMVVRSIKREKLSIGYNYNSSFILLLYQLSIIKDSIAGATVTFCYEPYSLIQLKKDCIST